MVLGFAAIFLAQFVLLYRHRRRYLHASRSLEEAPLEFGAEAVAGIVELEPGQRFGARVEIYQEGKNLTTSKGGKNHSWKEKSRQSFSEPFWIRHSSGARIYVERANNIFLVDSLSRTIHDLPLGRYRIAELVRGEFVVAEGNLQKQRGSGQGDYRGLGEEMWVLKTPDSGILHVSAESLCERHRRKFSRMMKALSFATVPFAIFAALMLSTYLAQSVYPRVTSGNVRGLTHWTTTHKGRTTQHYGMEFDYVDLSGREIFDDVEISRFDQVRLQRGDDVAVLLSPMGDCAGMTPSLHMAKLILSVIAVLMALAALFVARKKEWWEGALNEGGGGHIGPPSPHVPPGTILSRGD